MIVVSANEVHEGGKNIRAVYRSPGENPDGLPTLSWKCLGCQEHREFLPDFSHVCPGQTLSAPNSSATAIAVG